MIKALNKLNRSALVMIDDNRIAQANGYYFAPKEGTEGIVAVRTG